MAQRGALVAGVNAARKRGQKRHAVYEDPLLVYGEKATKEAHAARVQELDSILKQREEESFFTLDGISKAQLKKEVRVEQLMILVQQRLFKTDKFSRLLSVIIFFIVYIIALFLQRTPTTAFEIESSFLLSLVASLPTNFFLTGDSDLYDWFDEKLLQQVFSNPSCGDGICNRPEEFPGFGRFGCIEDCGKYVQTTQMYVDFKTWVDTTKADLTADTTDETYGIDLTRNMRRDITPDYKFNVFSDTMGAYLFAEDQVASGSTLVEVPDGKLTLHLYQTRKTSEAIDTGDMFQQIFTVPSTLPERTATSDFAYGDVREALSAAAILQKQINDYCFGGFLDPNDPLDSQVFFTQCLFIPSVDTYLRIMGTYGVRGTLTIPNGTKSRRVLAELPFCGLVKGGVTGLKDPSNKQQVVAAAMPCPTARRGLGGGGDLPQEARREAAGRMFKQKAGVLRKMLEGGWGEKDGGDPDGAKLVLARRRAIALHPSLKPTLPTELAIREGARARAEERTRATASVRAHPAMAETRGAGGGGARSLLATNVGMGGSCVSHSECSPNATDKYLPAGGNVGSFCTGGGTCDTCSACQYDKIDAIDDQCPQDRCPSSGLFPECVDAKKLTEGWTCPETKEFEIWRFFPKGTTVQVAPVVGAKIRYATPFNRLVGPILVTQRRRDLGTCDAVFNPSALEFSKRTGCQRPQTRDGRPYGFDPTFISSAEIYDGKVDPWRYYTPSERINTTTVVRDINGNEVNQTVSSTPLGFFPHQYDAHTKQEKAPEEIREVDRNLFHLFFDTRVSSDQAQLMLQYLKDGSFIDSQTKQVFVRFVTFNPNLNHFTWVTFTFTWNEGGNIAWDWFIQTVYVDIYTGAHGQAQLIVEIICILMLAINCIAEARDLMRAVRTFRLVDYFSSCGNWFDVLHIVLMWIAWGYWAFHYNMTAAFTMSPQGYPVLDNPSASARPFMTNSTIEMEYLKFNDEIRMAANSLAQYSAITSCCVIFFILRMVKGLDFQEQVGLITRTIIESGYDLIHFAILFLFIFVGYAMTGTLIFGHQFFQMSTVQESMIFLFFQIVAFDYSEFWDAIQHAAPDWAFHLWVWSFMFIVWLILFNILLAILIEGYVKVKELTKNVRGIHEDLNDVLSHWLRSILLPKRLFMSDARVLECLEKQKAGMPSTAQLREALITSLSQSMIVYLPGGVEIDEFTMLQLMRQPDAASASTRRKRLSFVVDPDSMQESLNSMKPDGLEYKDEKEEELIQDLMERYGDEKPDYDVQNDDLLDHLGMEALVQSLASFRGQQEMLKKVRKLEWQIDRICMEVLPAHEAREVLHLAAKPPHKPVRGGVVRVCVVEAMGLPKMDLIRSIDPYVLVFLADDLGENTTGAVSFKTEVKRSERDPKWDEETELPITGRATALTATIFDHDIASADDLVGCVHVHLSDLDPGLEVDEWYDIVNPHISQRKLRDAKLHLRISYLPTLDGVLVQPADVPPQNPWGGVYPSPTSQPPALDYTPAPGGLNRES